MKKSIHLILFALLTVFSVRAQYFEDKGIYYIGISGADGQVAVTSSGNSYSQYTGSVVIPATVTYNGTTYRVTAIRSYAFRNCSGLTSVTIPNSVTSIGEYAFYNCSGLTSVMIPNNVDSIGRAAFSGCTSLRSVEWNAVACQIPNATDISDVPFDNCHNITTMSFGNQVEHIPAYLCYGMDKLTSVMIPESVTSIGEGAFYGCTSITSPLHNSKIFAYLPQDYSGEYAIPSGIQSIAGGAFVYCIGLTSVTIPNSVTSIGEWAFQNCSGLTLLTIPNSVTSIGDGAFLECSGLTSVTIPNSVTSIGAGAFQNCSGLTSVMIPESVTSIGVGAFQGCTSIQSPLYNSKIFAYMPQNYSGEYAIPSGIQSIAGRAFKQCSGLTSVTIPESVTSIGDWAFWDCTGLTSVTIPASVGTIGEYAFFTDLTSVTSLAKNPPVCVSSVFWNYSVPLFVPRGCKETYQTADEWSKFTTIYENGFDGTGLITVLPNDSTMGSVTGSGQYEIGAEITLEAFPKEGYYFVRWDDGNTDNPRTLTVAFDITLTAIFAKEGDDPTANESPEADNFRVYVHDRTIHLSEDRGLVQVYNMSGQCVYNGHATAIPVPQGGVYIVVVNNHRLKVMVR